MVANDTELTGNGKRIKIETIRNGRAPLSGEFSLYIPWVGVTPNIAFDATPALLEAALMSKHISLSIFIRKIKNIDK